MTADEYKRRKRAQRYQANREKEIARSKAYQAAHAEELREKRMERYRTLKAKGLCVLCGKAHAIEGQTRCERCKAFHAIYAKRRRLDDEGAEAAAPVLSRSSRTRAGSGCEVQGDTPGAASGKGAGAVLVKARAGLWWQGIIHGLSKFSPIEFRPSARYFQGDKSPIEMQKAAEGYSAAWQHHKGHNPHHWEYWTDYDENGAVIANMMPYRYVVEMVCDWVGAGMVYSGEKWTQAAPMDYYKQVRSGRHFHPKTEMLIIEFLKCIRDKGLDEFHKMARCESPYSYLRIDYCGEYVP